ncbi:MAG: DJ-1/PfpI family protein [Steroidobacteraceae bacterium]
MPRAIKRAPKPEVTTSKALSLMALPGDGSIATRKIAVLIANGMIGTGMETLIQALQKVGAVPRLIGSRLGTVTGRAGEKFEVDATLENSPAVLFDALVLPDGAEAVAALERDGHSMEFLKDQYRHCKSILVIGAASQLLEKAKIPSMLPGGDPDPGVLLAASPTKVDPRAFITAIAQHRHPLRDSDPPLI